MSCNLNDVVFFPIRERSYVGPDPHLIDWPRQHGIGSLSAGDQKVSDRVKYAPPDDIIVGENYARMARYMSISAKATEFSVGVIRPVFWL